jgi:hypothetical protein
MGKNRKNKGKKTAGGVASNNVATVGIQAAVAKGSIAIDDGTIISLSKKLLKQSISNSEIIANANVPDAILAGRRSRAVPEPCCNIVLVKGDTLQGLQCARQIAEQGSQNIISDPAVLVFASDTNPGGSATSSNLGTQEEALCRTSTLRLAQVTLDYPIPTKGVAYLPHVQALLASPSPGPFASHGTNRNNNKKTNQSAPTFAAICGALRSCVSGPSPSSKEDVFLTEKICGILDQACVHGHTTLVLGSWGCGAFGNPVEWIAQTFRRCLSMDRYVGCFLHVILAIPNKSMLAAFEEVFGIAATVR